MALALDLAFSGGGTRGVALAGAMDVLEQQKPVLRRLIGTSAGSIAALFGAAGATARDYLKLIPAKAGDAFEFNSFFQPPSGETIREAARKKDSETRKLLRASVDGAVDKVLAGLTERRPRIGEILQGVFALGKQPLYDLAFEGFLNRAAERDDPARPRPRAAIFSLLEFGGIFDARLFPHWVAEILAKHVPGFTAQTTFAEFQKLTKDLNRELSVVVTDTTAKQPLVLNHRTAPQCPVCEAVLMSISVPFVWPETPWKREWGTYLGQDIEGHHMVDGGVLMNFPLKYLVHRKAHEVLAIMGDPEPAAVIGVLLDGSKPADGDTPPAKGDSPEFRLLDQIHRLVDTLKSFQAAHTAGMEEFICTVGCHGHPALERQSTADAVVRLQTLINAGRCAMRDHIKKRRLF